MNVCLLLVPEERVEEGVHQIAVSQGVGAVKEHFQEVRNVVLPPLRNLPNFLSSRQIKARFSQAEKKNKVLDQNFASKLLL